MAEFKVGDKVLIKTYSRGFEYGIIEELRLSEVRCIMEYFRGWLIHSYPPDRIRLISDLTELERLIYNVNVEE